MSIPDITPPTPGQYPWAEELNEDLLAINEGIQTVNESLVEYTDALSITDGAVAALIDDPDSSTNRAVKAPLQTHINAPEPHPAYDDIPSLTLLFENGIV